MKALVYHGPGKRAWEERPKPAPKESTHRFALDDRAKAYDTFGNAAREGALKVLIAAAGA
jgi:hypothetical protein